MEIIKSYLETMFAELQATPEVLKAKDELFGMMEDKYNELICDGKSENEAIGTVIAEFGNLDELADILGLNKSTVTFVDNRRILSLTEVKEYIRSKARYGLMIAIGVFLCIFSVVFPAVFECFNNEILESVGAVIMLLVIAVAVGVFIVANAADKKYSCINKRECIIDYEAAKFIKNEKIRIHNISVLYITAGVILCIISVIPAIIFDAFPIGVLENMGGISFLVIASVAVFLIVYGSTSEKPYKTLLLLNGENIEKGCVKKEKNRVRYINGTAETIMSVYWPTVTCLYLSVSFITFSWHLTWVIWPVAGILHAVFKSILKEDVREMEE